MHSAKKYCLGFGVAPQAPIPLYPMGQQRCFWIPRTVVFEMHNVKKYWLGSGVAPQAPIQTTVSHGPATVFLDTWNGVVRNAQCEKISFWFWGGAPSTHTTVPHGPAKVHWIPSMVVFEMHCAGKYRLGFGVAPQAPIPLYHIGQQRCFWIPRMGCLNCTRRKILFGLWGGAPKTDTTVLHRLAKDVFGYLGWGCLNCTMRNKFVWVLGWRSKHPYHCTP